MNKRIVFILAVGMIFVVAMPGPGRASFHLLKVNEVFLGAPGNENVQYVELKAALGGQGLVDGSELVLYGAGSSTTPVAEAELTEDIEKFPNQGSILFATTQAEAFFEVTADAAFTAQSVAGGGMACFEDGGSKIDCVSWGARDANSAAGNPFRPTEGIPSGATIGRDSGGDNLTNSDDHGNSRTDFELVHPSPSSSSGLHEADPPLIEFDSSAVDMEETVGETSIGIGYADPPRDEEYSVQFEMDGIEATEGVDFADDDSTLVLVSEDNSISRQVNGGVNDATFEGAERVRLTLRDPTGGALLGDQIDSLVRINDLEDDTDEPESRITRPDNGESYRRAALDTIDGRWEDGPGIVDEVFVGLRQTLRSGRCRWFDGDEFSPRKCSRKDLLLEQTASDGTWDYELQPLPRSVGTKVRFYTVFSKAVDRSGNGETAFEQGRNVNKFEVK